MLLPVSGCGCGGAGLCDRVMLLEQGASIMVGAKDMVVDHYLRHIEPIRQTSFSHPELRKGTGTVRFTSLAMMHAGQIASTFSSGQDITFRIQYASAYPSLSGLEIRIVIKSYSGLVVFAMCSSADIALISELPGTGDAECAVPRFPLNLGLYHIDLELYQAAALVDLVPSAHQFEVTKGDYYKTGYLPDSKFMFLSDYAWVINGA